MNHAATQVRVVSGTYMLPLLNVQRREKQRNKRSRLSKEHKERPEDRHIKVPAEHEHATRSTQTLCERRRQGSGATTGSRDSLLVYIIEHRHRDHKTNETDQAQDPDPGPRPGTPTRDPGESWGRSAVRPRGCSTVTMHPELTSDDQ